MNDEQTKGESERQPDRHTDRQTDRQPKREIEGDGRKFSLF